MLRRLFRIAGWIAGTIALAFVVLVAAYSFVPPVSTLMVWRWATGERVVRQWRPIEAISPNLVRAVVVGEDARFCNHSGVDWIEVRAAIADADELADARGASTIAMQTARNLFLWPSRQVVRKIMEVPIAYVLTLAWPQRRLLEVYLNIVEWGPNGEFGAEAAARRAFGRSARNLTPYEAALLASSLPNPVRRNAARPGPGLRRVAERNLAGVAADGGNAIECLDLRR
ncbi:MAG: monofunctional biosynthetic peptidoglycan transglycosylase [Bradyrhizobiaceae bacterium]|nr:monofunctional biosynthetic peptidoglycan transglycosylase [Bradyrhizobiaceae bacterium]